MALAADALVSVQEAREYLDVLSQGKPSDDWLEAVLNGVSSEVAEYTGRLYKPADDEAREVQFEHDGTEALVIDDCREPTLVRTSLTPKVDDSWEELDDDAWRAEPLRDDVKRMIRFSNTLPATGTGWGALAAHVDPIYTEWPREGRLNHFQVVEVTAKWGHEEVPSQVKLATVMWVQNISKRDQAFFSTQFAEGSAPLPGPMPEDVKQILEQEREPGATVIAV